MEANVTAIVVMTNIVLQDDMLNHGLG